MIDGQRDCALKEQAAGNRPPCRVKSKWIIKRFPHNLNTS